MLAQALTWLASGVKTGRLGLDLLPEEFDEDEIRAMYRAIFGSHKAASHWLRRMEKEGRVEPRGGSGRLYHAIEPT